MQKHAIIIEGKTKVMYLDYIFKDLLLSNSAWPTLDFE